MVFCFLLSKFQAQANVECETWDYQTTSLSALKVRETHIVNFVCLFTRAAWRVLNYAKWLRWNGGGGGGGVGGGGAKRWHVEEMHLEAKPRYRYFASFFSLSGDPVGIWCFFRLFAPFRRISARYPAGGFLVSPPDSSQRRGEPGDYNHHHHSEVNILCCSPKIFLQNLWTKSWIFAFFVCHKNLFVEKSTRIMSIFLWPLLNRAQGEELWNTTFPNLVEMLLVTFQAIEK